jgi:hypothetical protein
VSDTIPRITKIIPASGAIFISPRSLSERNVLPQ